MTNSHKNYNMSHMLVYLIILGQLSLDLKTTKERINTVVVKDIQKHCTNL